MPNKRNLNGARNRVRARALSLASSPRDEEDDRLEQTQTSSAKRTRGSIGRHLFERIGEGGMERGRGGKAGDRE